MWPRCDGTDSSDGQGRIHSLATRGVKVWRMFDLEMWCVEIRPVDDLHVCESEVVTRRWGSRRVDAMPDEVCDPRGLRCALHLIGRHCWAALVYQAQFCLAVPGIFPGTNPVLRDMASKRQEALARSNTIARGGMDGCGGLFLGYAPPPAAAVNKTSLCRRFSSARLSCRGESLPLSKLSGLRR